MKPWAVSALIFLLAATPAIAQERWMSLAGRDHPLAGSVWDVAAAAFLSAADLIAKLSAANIVLLGETHTNPDHHRLQARIVAGLGAAGGFQAVAFEMLDQSQAPALARHLDEVGTAEGLGRAVGWRRWPDWRQKYQPIAGAALTAGMTIIAGNAEESVLRGAVRGGPDALEPEFAARTRFNVPLEPKAEEVLIAELTSAHCGMDVSAIATLVTAQRVWDSSMADALAAAGKSILIAGSGHTRTDRAVPWVLGLMRPRDTVAALAFVEVAADFDVPGDYAVLFGNPGLPYDYVWFTPSVPPSAATEPCQ